MADTADLIEIIAWLLPYAQWPECICDKGTVGECDCNLTEAQANYHSTVKAAQQALSAYEAFDSGSSGVSGDQP